MLFIHQQIQSFLNLGACKEYLIVARPKSPKKNTGLTETVSTPTPSPSVSDTSVTPAEAVAAAVPQTEPRDTRPRKTANKPEIVKSDSRSKLVPINMEDEIRRAAYLMSERRGFEPGHESEDWVAAENEVRQRYHQHSASA
jgi:hypothetical protein